MIKYKKTDNFNHKIHTIFLNRASVDNLFMVQDNFTKELTL